MPSFSIIVPIYNVQDYLRECLDSIKAQTVDDFEALCVIDGSTDGSLDIAREYADVDARFQVLVKENGGLSSARNHGIAHAKGEYLVFVDADDCVEPTCIACLSAAFSRTGAQVVVFGASVFPEEANTPWYDEVLTPCEVVFNSFAPEFMFAPYTTPFAWRCAVRRETLLSTGVTFDEGIAFGEDVVFQFALYPRAGRLAAISDKLYRYRLNRAGSLMDNWSSDERRLTTHVEMVGIVFADWESLGLIERYGHDLFDWSIDNLLYGVERLNDKALDEQCRKANSLWGRYFNNGSMHPVQVDKRCLCRGEGKLYWECEVGTLTPFHTLECTATIDGASVPVGAYPRLDGQNGCRQTWVLEIPWCATRDIVIALQPDGRSFERTSVTCSYQHAKWSSRLNYLVHADVCEVIRDYEQGFVEGHYQVAIDQRFPLGKEAVWRVSVTWRGDSQAIPRFILQDGVGARLQGLVQLMEVQDGECNKAVASIRLPDTCNHFLVSAYDEEGRMASGFAVVDPEVAREARRAADDLMRHAGQDDAAYRIWLEAKRPSASDLERQHEHRWEDPIMFSCLVIADGTSLEVLTSTLQSIREQTYGWWEATVVSSGGFKELSDASHASTVEEALNKATGDFAVVLYGGDTIEPNALYEYALTLLSCADAQADVLFCDEDVLRSDGTYCTPLFKSQLNLDLLYCGNWLGSLLAIRLTLLAKIVGQGDMLQEAWAYDVVLHAFEADAVFKYVPRVLYHALTSPFPGAHRQAMRFALQSHLLRRGVVADVRERLDARGLKVWYSIPEPNPLVSIIIPSKDQSDLLEACVASIAERATYRAFEIIIVENNSEEPETPSRYAQIELRFECVRIVHWADEFNYSNIVNYGASQARGDYLLFLNNDTRVINPDFIQEMLGFLQRPEVGVVGARLLFEDELVQHAGIAVGVWDAVVHVNQNRAVSDGGYLDRACLSGNFSAVTGACQMVRRSTFEQVGGYDSRFAIGFNDVDFCFKVRKAGKYVVLAPDALLYHREFASRGREVGGEKLARWQRERELFEREWPDPFCKGDPFTSPNLKRNNTYYRLDDDAQSGRGPAVLAMLAKKLLGLTARAMRILPRGIRGRKN